MSGWEIFVMLSAGLAALLLLIFGARETLTRPENRTKGLLMIAVAIVTVINLAIWLTWPVPS